MDRRPPLACEPLIRHVRIRNYRGIGNCDVQFKPLTVFVGRNGAGKSNFLDALRFLMEGLQTSLDHALRERGGIDAVRRKSQGHPRNFAVEVDMQLDEHEGATYGFEVAARKKGSFIVKQERLRVYHLGTGQERGAFRVTAGVVDNQAGEVMPPAQIDRLYLVNASGLPKFRPVYDALLSMGFYNLNPEQMKEPQNPDAGELLRRDGSNVASVIGRLKSDAPSSLSRVWTYLDAIVPGVEEARRVAMGQKESLEFRQKVKGSPSAWRFHAHSMSDGTLRALGALVAVAQLYERRGSVRFVGIEEPETALHPAAASVLVDALREASRHTQVAVTTHSDDILESIDLETDGLIVVQSDEGTTEMAPVDATSRKAIRDHLYTPGEMLRMDQLTADEADLERQRQGTLFDLLKAGRE